MVLAPVKEKPVVSLVKLVPPIPNAATASWILTRVNAAILRESRVDVPRDLYVTAHVTACASPRLSAVTGSWNRRKKSAILQGKVRLPVQCLERFVTKAAKTVGIRLFAEMEYERKVKSAILQGLTLTPLTWDSCDPSAIQHAMLGLIRCRIAEMECEREVKSAILQISLLLNVPTDNFVIHCAPLAIFPFARCPLIAMIRIRAPQKGARRVYVVTPLLANAAPPVNNPSVLQGKPAAAFANA